MNLFVPSHTQAAVEGYDSSLRVRWLRRSEMYAIERKMPRSHPDYVKVMPSPLKSPKGLDLWDGWREGYLHIMSIHPTLIHDTNLILSALAESDAWRHGGWEAMNRKLDEASRKEEEAADRHIDNWLEAATSDAYDQLQWRLGNRMAVAPSPPACQHETTEQHDGFVVHVRRGCGA